MNYQVLDNMNSGLDRAQMFIENHDTMRSNILNSIDQTNDQIVSLLMKSGMKTI